MKKKKTIIAISVSALLLLAGCDAPSSKPSTQAVVSGGAWLNKEAGNSDILRGLKIYLLNADVNSRQLIEILTPYLDCLKNDLARCKMNLAKVEVEIKKLDRIKNGTEYEFKKLYRTSIIKHMSYILISEEEISKAVERHHSDPISLKELYEVQKSLSGDYAPAWIKVIAGQILGETHTSIDGTFELPLKEKSYYLPLKEKSYYLYSRYETDYSVVEWFVPITAQGSESIKVDLQNSNASFIHNKQEEK